MAPDPRGPLRVALACEDQAQRSLLVHLTRNVVEREARERGAHWLTDLLDEQLAFCGLRDHEGTPAHLRCYLLQNITEDFQALRIQGRPVRLNALRDGRPAGAETQRWRRLVLLFEVQPVPPDVLIVALDTDGYPERRAELEAAMPSPPPLCILLATPHPEAEAWFIAGFEPRDPREQARLEAFKRDPARKLNFVPTEEPHRLTSHPNEAPTDAKRVLRLLMFGDATSRPPDLDELPALSERLLSNLELLSRRGEASHLTDFLHQLRKRLVPLLLPGPPHA
ncbi:hypothetical protein [Chondromyces crocatus]|uniref:Uncharacterized protein n=1 Tax=Chondromyces crocatus TaxID=52 RepID=A0A0K1EA51_CHOCO|nr:hypothetical protein [Chondromyces crocatus]AKT37745.1 uncharacterized protein CMC5_018870 [Chondromyces crocatus]